MKPFIRDLASSLIALVFWSVIVVFGVLGIMGVGYVGQYTSDNSTPLAAKLAANWVRADKCRAAFGEMIEGNCYTIEHPIKRIRLEGE